MAFPPYPRPIAPQVVAVVGGGFSGTLVAVNLARSARSRGRPLRVVVFEREARLARGVAYATTCGRHPLNAPAASMSALPDEPGHFLDWLQARDPSATGSTFAPRSLYGAYLEDLLHDAGRRPGVSLVAVREEVVDLFAHAGGAGVSLVTRSGRTFRADRAVLALGPLAPEGIAVGAERFGATGRYVADPGRGDALGGLPPSGSLVLVGAGLTAVDLIVAARAVGHTGPITVVSRHGHLPGPYRPANPGPSGPIGPTPMPLRAVLGNLRREAARCRRDGRDARAALDALRPDLPGLWRGLSGVEKRRFLRHLLAQWDAHRHRVAPEVARELDDARREGQLTVLAGRVRAVEPLLRDEGVIVRFTRRAAPAGAAESILAHRVVNCADGSHVVRPGRSPLLDALLDRGLARRGPFGLGLEVTHPGALVAADGTPGDRILAVGPALRGQLWEPTSVTALRTQARDLARHLLVTTCPDDDTTAAPTLVSLPAPVSQRLGKSA
jgi:uncharacterized NAD(P)/FAD-binding protein YdhS